KRVAIHYLPTKQHQACNTLYRFVLLWTATLRPYSLRLNSAPKRRDLPLFWPIQLLEICTIGTI
ncbi:hypothetical protein, partial [Enterobacter cloacae]|uniref:hypothetical protein n=1 Tax=Enterobacter cloacae TaxID=550 RepID=UPI001C3FEBB0